MSTVAGISAAGVLARFADRDGTSRLIVVLDRCDHSALVLDCAEDRGDARVLGVIAADEPSGNARLLARMYLADTERPRPRPLVDDDLHASRPRPASLERSPGPAALLDAVGNTFTIAAVEDGGLPELRWTRAREPADARPSEPVSLRATLGALECYEPPCSMTALAVALAPQSTTVVRLRGELDRIRSSPIVLNRGLREAVERAVSAGVSLSEIAMRCGRFKADRRGNRSGETSWLARRIGNLPEGGRTSATPWIHSDTLALIAREGLGVSPREVEL